MKKIDHVRKTVYIIVGCLTIVSLTFTICTKIGHCASSDTSNDLYNSPPFPIGQYNGYLNSTPNVYFTDETVDFILTSLQNNSSFQVSKDYMSMITITEPFQGTGFIIKVWFNNAPSIRHDPHFEPHGSIDSGSLYYRLWGTYATGTVTYNSFTDTVSFVYGGFTNLGYMDLTIPVASQPNNSYGVSVYNKNIANYPVWTKGHNAILDTNGDTIFSYDVNGGGPIFNGHTKGGVLSNYIDSHELLEDSSDLPEVDVTPPSDPTTNNLLQKILNGLGVLNGSIQGGVLTIGDYIGQGFENVLNWFTEPFDQDAFSDELDQVFLLSDILGAKDLIDQSGIFDWEDITPSQNVSWTFDFGGAVLPHTSCTIDFSWYTGTVKNIIVTLICTFLVVGLLATLFNSIPSIISGHSGDKGGGSDS